MSSIDKLEKKIRNNPNDVKLSDIQKLLEHYGFELQTINGSHFNYIHPDLGKNITDIVTLPRNGNLVKRIYILKALEKIDLTQEF